MNTLIKKWSCIFSITLLGMFPQLVFGNNATAFLSAKTEIENMLSGNTALSYERAIFITENAYYNNALSEKEYTDAIDIHVSNIKQLIKANRTKQPTDFKDDFKSMAETKASDYETALTNFCIYSYLTDTTFFVPDNKILYHLPYQYSTSDPLGTLNLQNTQVVNLLFNPESKGNCFALASLFKIFSERLQSKAMLCTTAGHIYIRHADEKGIFHNIEISSQSFPGSGSLSAISYTTDQALKNEISLRKLDLRQSVGLCLIYLAKGYEVVNNTKTDEFIMSCSDLALKYDALNLNAMLLKSEVMEARLMNEHKTPSQLQSDKLFQQYEALIVHLFDLGYREMPMEQKRMIVEKLRNPEMTFASANQQLVTAKKKSYETRTATLSWGVLDEEMNTKPTEIYNHTAFNTTTKKISKFIQVDTTNYPIDFAVFAWQVDPLAAKYPSMSPYVAFNDNPILYIDIDGKEGVLYLVNTGGLTPEQMNNIAKEVNQNFVDMKMETRAMIYTGNDFSKVYSKMAKTDAVVYIGTEKSVIDQINKVNPNTANVLRNDPDFGSEGKCNPEISENPYGTPGGNKIIAINLEDAKLQSTEHLKVSLEQGIAYNITHGAGHNASLDHQGPFGRDKKYGYIPYGSVMSDGPLVERYLNQGKKPLVPQFTKLRDIYLTSENQGIIKAYFNARFGTSKAKPSPEIPVKTN